MKIIRNTNNFSLLIIIGFLWTAFMIFFAPKRSDVVINEFMSLDESVRYDVVHSQDGLSDLSKRSLHRGKLGKLFSCMKSYGSYEFSLRSSGSGYAVLNLENGMELSLYSNEDFINMFTIYTSDSKGSRKYSVSCNISLLNK